MDDLLVFVVVRAYMHFNFFLLFSFKNTNDLNIGAHTCNLSYQRLKQENGCDFKARLVYRVRFLS